MDKWQKLKSQIEADLSWMVQYSHDKMFDRAMSDRYLKLMNKLEQEENEIHSTSRIDNVSSS
jgi:hypothetical protein